MTFDWDDCSPRDLAAEADLGRLLEAARSLDAWTPRSAEVVDYVLRARLARLLGGVEWSEPELRAFQRAVERIHRPRLLPSLSAMERPYAARWDLLRELIDDCVELLRARAPEAVRGRKHVREILAALKNSGGKAAQQTLRNELGLAPANFTRVLNLMEMNRLIRRSTVGRDNEVELTTAERAKDTDAETPTAAPAPASTPSGRSGYRHLLLPRSPSAPSARIAAPAVRRKSRSRP
jgi:hypothetical protein